MFSAIKRWRPYSQYKDLYGCLHLNLVTQHSASELNKKVDELLEEQTTSNCKALWIHLNRINLHLCSALLEKKFKIHHAVQNEVAMYRWLAPTSDLVPKHSKFSAAAGGVVLLDDRVLLVKESSGVRNGLWGVPSGHLEPNEPITKGTEREFFEETGMRATFKHLLSMREIYGPNGSEYYFVSMLQLPQGEEKNLKLCTTELCDGRWVHLSDLSDWVDKHPVGLQASMLKHLSELYKAKFDFHQTRPLIHQEKMYKGRSEDVKFYEHHLADWSLLKA